MTRVAQDGRSPTSEKLGLSADALAVQPTVFAPDARAAYPRSNPMMRAGSPWDIAEASVYLAGSSGKFITGETLTVDGGAQLWGETWTTGKPAYFCGGDE